MHEKTSHKLPCCALTYLHRDQAASSGTIIFSKGHIATGHTHIHSCHFNVNFVPIYVIHVTFDRKIHWHTISSSIWFIADVLLVVSISCFVNLGSNRVGEELAGVRVGGVWGEVQAKHNEVVADFAAICKVGWRAWLGHCKREGIIIYHVPSFPLKVIQFIFIIDPCPYIFISNTCMVLKIHYMLSMR